MMKAKDWIVFLGLGILMLAFSLHNALYIPLFTPAAHWQWLTSETDVLDYIRYYFRVQGIWQLGFAVMVLITAVTGYRRRQLWAWYAMWSVPLVLVLVTLMMVWLIPITGLLIIAAAAALLLSRSQFSPA
jgi:hypothetical protein